MPPPRPPPPQPRRPLPNPSARPSPCGGAAGKARQGSDGSDACLTPSSLTLPRRASAVLRSTAKGGALLDILVTHEINSHAQGYR
jgi:hypothetical protein